MESMSELSKNCSGRAPSASGTPETWSRLATATGFTRSASTRSPRPPARTRRPSIVISKSKDELVAECLRELTRDFDLAWADIERRHAGEPKQQLLALLRLS